MESSKSLRFITHQSFFSAVRSSDLESLKQIVEKLARDEQPNGSSPVYDLMAMQNDAGQTALYIAAENDLGSVFSYLIKFCDCEVAKIRSKSDMDAFHVAAKKGHLGMILILFDFERLR
uniref:Ankyrin repeat-containing protein At2g01680 n=1 Tax=Rhizophora mucronata TaxID=61149 RepID=A0A2P2JH77_RHIMU